MGGDPLHYSRRVLLEVWHNPNISESGEDGDCEMEMNGCGYCHVEDEQAEFMGEVDIILDMPTRDLLPDKEDTFTRRVTVPLDSNPEKARRRVRGQLTFEYTWRPTPVDKCSSDALLCGELKVTVLSGDDLIAIDWKGSCSSDPYCVVVAYPHSPPTDGKVPGKVEACWHKSPTLQDTSNPHWNYTCSFDVHWTKAGSESCMAADMRQLGSKGVEQSPISSAPSRKSTATSALSRPQAEMSDKEKSEQMRRIVPELQADILNLKGWESKIEREIGDVREDLDMIITCLRKRGLIQGTANSSEAAGQNAEQSRSAGSRP